MFYFVVFLGYVKNNSHMLVRNLLNCQLDVVGKAL